MCPVREFWILFEYWLVIFAHLDGHITNSYRQMTLHIVSDSQNRFANIAKIDDSLIENNCPPQFFNRLIKTRIH